jgi:ADP-ribosylglycohydrolase
MKELMKVDDCVIVSDYSRFYGNKYSLSKIIKINKATYKISNGSLYYIDGLSQRIAYDQWSTSRSSIAVFNKTRWEEIKLEIKENKIEKIKKELSKIVKNYNYDLVSESLKALENE